MQSAFIPFGYFAIVAYCQILLLVRFTSQSLRKKYVYVVYEGRAYLALVGE
jgi:hypothetical protein